MNIRSGATEIPAEAPAQQRKITDRAREVARIVKRLQRVVATHVEGSAKIRCPFGLPDVLAVIAALQAEANGLSPISHLDSGEEVSTYLRGGMYEELLAEPSNIFSTIQVSSEVIRYEALPNDFWIERLDALSSDLAALTSRHS